MHDRTCCSRRTFLRGTAGAVAAGWALRWPLAATAQSAPTATAGIAAQSSQSAAPTLAALTAGDTRADNVFRALEMIEPQVRASLARKKRVIIKPNVVVTDNQLAATHTDCIEAILEFIQPMVKDEILIGDSPAGGQVTAGFDNYNYLRLQKRYNVKFVNFDEMPTVVRHVSDHRHRPIAVRFVELMLDPDTYIISAAVPKTHDRAICTLSLKNIVVGAAIKDKQFRWGADNGFHNDKVFIHGGPNNEAIHYNLFSMAKVLRPDLSVLDGFAGMQGNGPIAGTPVDHRIAVASTDFLAADRVGVELMGFDFAQVGYLTFCAGAGLGEGDLSRIDLQGERIADHVRPYQPHETIEQQLEWMTRGA